MKPSESVRYPQPGVGSRTSTSPGDGRAVAESRTDVQRLGVTDDVDLGALARRPPILGIELREGGDRHGARPRGVIEAAVEHEASLCAPRACHGPLRMRHGSRLRGNG